MSVRSRGHPAPQQHPLLLTCDTEEENGHQLGSIIVPFGTSYINAASVHVHVRARSIYRAGELPSGVPSAPTTSTTELLKIK